MKPEEFEAQNWYQIKLGENYQPTNHSKITRVPGGWIYSDLGGTTFIPWHNEFESEAET